MATMFYQQLINRKTFPHDGPFQIPLHDREYDNARGCCRCSGQNETEGKREKRKGVHVAHFSRESLRALQPERRNIRARFVYEWSVHV